MTFRRLLPLALSAAFVPFAAQAGGWNETTQGDLSNSGTAPTAVSMTLGSNVMQGTSGRVSGVIDRDYFTFTIPAGLQLSAITILAGTSPGGTQSFLGVAAGSQVTTDPNSGSAAGLLGWTLFSGGKDATGVDILPYMGVPDLGSSGFTPPLPAGTYAFWLQEFSTGTFPYRLDFTVSAVPEPATLALWAAGLAGFGLMRRRKA